MKFIKLHLYSDNSVVVVNLDEIGYVIRDKDNPQKTKVSLSSSQNVTSISVKENPEKIYSIIEKISG